MIGFDLYCRKYRLCADYKGPLCAVTVVITYSDVTVELRGLVSVVVSRDLVNFVYIRLWVRKIDFIFILGNDGGWGGGGGLVLI